MDNMSWEGIIRTLGSSQLIKISLMKILRFEEAILRLPDGMRIIIDLNQVPRIFNNILHIYHYMDYAFIPEALPKAGWSIIDAGAYLGAYTLWSAQRVGVEGKVIALEPHPRSLELLKRTIKFNRLQNVKALPYALSSHDGRCVLYSPRYRALASLRKEHVEYLCGEVAEKYEVECISLKTLLNMFKLDRIDLLKLDIEGLEYDALKHSTDMLSNIERIVVEVHLEACSIPKLDRLLRENGFDVIIRFDTRAENQAFIIALRKE